MTLPPGGFASAQVGLLIFLTALLLIVALNWRGLRPLTPGPPPDPAPLVSILVPARDEEANIAACVASLLAQDYPNFELHVLDDASSDATRAILLDLAAADPRLIVHDGAPLPAGWLGKLWACDQLQRHARGELLLFTDADTRHQPAALSAAVAALLGHDPAAAPCDLLSALPEQLTPTWGERLTVPLIGWSLLSFLPLPLAHRLNWPPLTAAIGQYLLFRRRAYDQIGGHAAVRTTSADDLALARRIAAAGLRWQLRDGHAAVACRMYHDFTGARRGLSKSLFAAFDYRLWLFLPIWGWLGWVFLSPLLVIAATPLGGLSGARLDLALTAVALSLLQWGLTARRLARSPLEAALYPLTVALGVAIAAHSALTIRSGRAAWKDRPLPPPSPRRGMV